MFWPSVNSAVYPAQSADVANNRQVMKVVILPVHFAFGIFDMNRDVVLVFAEDDVGHFLLAKKYLTEQGVRNEMVRFPDGRSTLDFFFMQGTGPTRDPNREYVLILDIRMPGVDGFEVLRAIRADPELKDLPIIILSTTDNDEEVERCHELGCHAYIVKPVKYGSYIDAMRKVGLFPSLLSDGFVLQKQEPVKAGAD